MKGVRIGFAITGSFCTFASVMPLAGELKALGADITPIFSAAAYSTDTRFGLAREFIQTLENITGNKALHTLTEVEPIGPKALLDVLLVAPCTGNTLGKLTQGITDTSVTMACKSHLRNLRPIVLAVSTNDGLATAAKNIGELLTRKNVFFVPFGQDDPLKKPNSLVADMTLIPNAIRAALQGKQIQPVLLSH